MPRPTLSQRLRKLTAQGLLRRVQYSDVPNRSEYKLTEKGIDMYPVMLALLAFGDKWLVQSGKPPIYLVHNLCRCVCRPTIACSHCKSEVNVRTVAFRDGPGMGRTTVRHAAVGRSLARQWQAAAPAQAQGVWHRFRAPGRVRSMPPATPRCRDELQAQLPVAGRPRSASEGGAPDCVIHR